ncbi:MAG TPA: hypothetical protein VFQ88_07200 [Nevskiaceae bacterium]|nr:hypothetical protein [Nevskiaceae bacterium]
MSDKIFAVRNSAFPNPILVKAANRARARRFIFAGCVAEPASADDLLEANSRQAKIYDGTVDVSADQADVGSGAEGNVSGDVAASSPSAPLLPGV